MSIATEIQRLQTAKADIKEAIENKGVIVGDGTIDTYAEKIDEISVGSGGYDQGYEDGYNQANNGNPMYYMNVKDFQWYRKAFPENFDFVLNLRAAPDTLNAMLSQATGLKTVTIICDVSKSVSFGQIIRETTTEIIDLSKCKLTPSMMSYFAYGAKNLVSIRGALDLSNCTDANAAFLSAPSLKDIEFVSNTILISISFNACSLLTDKSIQSIIDGLADLTGGTAQTLTLHATVGAKLTDEQKATITAKNWTLVY